METNKRQNTTELRPGDQLDFGNLHKSELIKPWVLDFINKEAGKTVATESDTAPQSTAEVTPPTPYDIINFSTAGSNRNRQLELEPVQFWQETNESWQKAA